MQTLITPEFLENISSTRYAGNLVINSTDSLGLNINTKVNITGEYDSLNAATNITSGHESNVDFLFQTIDLDVRFLGTHQELAPRLYFKLNDISLPDETRNSINLLFSESSGYDLDSFSNVWWRLDFQELLDEGLIDNATLDSLSLNQDLSQDDYEEVILVLTAALSEYVFTDDSDKMIFKMGEMIGREEFKGTDTKRYKTAIDEDNFKAFLIELRDKFAETEAWKQLNFDQQFSIEDEFSEAMMDDIIADFVKNTEVEVWLDAENQIMRNMRFTNKNNQSYNYGSYSDLGFSFDEDVIVLTFASKSYDADSCKLFQEKAPDYFGSYTITETEDAEKCPYNYQAYEEPDCGLPPLINDYLNNSKKISDYYKEFDAYRYCRAPIVESLKDKAVPWSLDFDLRADVQSNSIDYGLLAKDEDWEIRLTLDVVGQETAAAVQAPEESKSILDLFQTIDDAFIDTPNLN